MFIKEIERIDELNMKFSVRARIAMIWRDARLYYKDLMNEPNSLDDRDLGLVWKPPLILSNSLELLRILDNKLLDIRIIKQSQGQFHDEKELNEGIFYDGNDNDLVMTARFYEEFSCSYDLIYYPFDFQICMINVGIPYHLQKYVNLVPGTIKFNGTNPSTAQFSFTSNEIKVEEYGAKINGIIELKRNPLYHVVLTYLPTFCISIMAIMTLYIDESHFEATIMVSLTSMLVMYTLFQSVSEDMPSTAYLKLMDIWLIFCLVLPFITFVIEVLWEFGRNYSKDHVKIFFVKKMPKSKCKVCIQIGMPILCSIFIIVYVYIVIQINR